LILVVITFVSGEVDAGAWVSDDLTIALPHELLDQFVGAVAECVANSLRTERRGRPASLAKSGGGAATPRARGER
jgi:hypothetical protein